MKYKGLLYLHSIAVALWAVAAQAATITVTTTDNSSGPGDGATSLDEALRAATDGDIIDPTDKTVDALMKLDLPAGVDVEIKLQ